MNMCLCLFILITNSTLRYDWCITEVQQALLKKKKKKRKDIIILKLLPLRYCQAVDASKKC